MFLKRPPDPISAKMGHNELYQQSLVDFCDSFTRIPKGCFTGTDCPVANKITLKYIDDIG